MHGWRTKLTTLQRWTEAHHSYQQLQRVFTRLLPLVVIGSWCEAILTSCVSRDGFFAQIYDLPHRLPGFPYWHQVFSLLSTFTLGLVGIAAAGISALVFAESAGRQRLAVGTALIAYLLLAATTDRGGIVTLTLPALSSAWLLAGLLLGAGCGWLARHRFAMVWSGLVVAIAAAGRVALQAIPHGSVIAVVTGAIAELERILGGLWLPIIQLASWLGLPVRQLALLDPHGAANLNYALAHAHLTQVPYPLTTATIYRPFATFGGMGATLGLLIAMLICHYRRRLAWSALGPGLVNLNLPLWLGVPVVLNPLLLIPYLLAPAACSVIAWGALALHLMPPAVYPLPDSTPGPLRAWLATNGNWAALAVAGVCLVVSVAIYLPFVRLVQAGGERHVA